MFFVFFNPTLLFSLYTGNLVNTIFVCVVIVWLKLLSVPLDLKAVFMLNVEAIRLIFLERPLMYGIVKNCCCGSVSFVLLLVLFLCLLTVSLINFRKYPCCKSFVRLSISFLKDSSLLQMITARLYKVRIIPCLDELE